jgi:hypothetical protein
MSEESTNPYAERIKKRRENAVQPEEFLKQVGAIRETGDEQKLGFTEDFATSLSEHVAEVREREISETELARLFGVPESKVLRKDRPYTSWRIRKTVYNWPSEGALVFDIATDETLRKITDEWVDVPPKQRFMIAQSLRSFQDECIFCAGDIVFNNNAVESCCSERRVLTLHCGGCERRFLEFATENKERGRIGQRS